MDIFIGFMVLVVVIFGAMVAILWVVAPNKPVYLPKTKIRSHVAGTDRKGRTGSGGVGSSCATPMGCASSTDSHGHGGGDGGGHGCSSGCSSGCGGD